MNYTEYFLLTRKREDRKRIRLEWIERTVQTPIRSERQTDGRIRLWAYIPEEDKYLRVIVLPDGETVHNAFLDRSFREDKT